MLDLIIKNGKIIDGTGKKEFKADIGIRKDKIRVIKNLKNTAAKRIIDAEKNFVTPGFIDITNHSDSYLTLFTLPTVDSLIHQGITTIICGNCGSSLAPLVSSLTKEDISRTAFYQANIILPPKKGEDIFEAIKKWGGMVGFNINWLTFSEFLKEIKRRKLAVNFGSLVGFETLLQILENEKETLSDKEVKIFQNLILDSIEQGALGISLGLEYSRGPSKISEIIKILSVLKNKKVFSSIHLRDEDGDVVSSVKEALRISKEVDTSLEISHFKIKGRKYWSKIDEFFDLITKAKEDGLRVNFDVYPYLKSYSLLYSYLPKWASFGGAEELLKRLKDESLKPKILKAIKDNLSIYSDLTISFSPFNKSFVGRKIKEIADDQGLKIEETVVNLLLGSRGYIRCFDGPDVVSEDNLEKLIQHPQSIIVSNGAAYNVEYAKKREIIHPRCFGTFPRFLGRYVRDKKLVSFEEGIKKITFLPAQKIGLKNRGAIKEGWPADIVIFDPDKISDRATFDNPYQYPRGINYVLVNGRVVLEKGSQTGELPGELV